MRVFMVSLVVLTLVATDARAGGEAPRQGDGSPRPDFLFARPRGSVNVRGDWLFARTDSDWYTFVTDQLTVERKDFNAPGVTTEVGIAVTRRADVLVGLEFNQASAVSEYRRFVDNNRLPISQTTRLRTLGLTGNVKLALTARGHEVSRLAWVPARWVPYVGAGGGVLRYDLVQYGDFVDFVDSSVFSSSFRSSGWTPTAQAFAGIDVKVLRRVYLTLDGRYRWAAASLGSTWVDFDPIDLAGFKLAAGASFVF